MLLAAPHTARAIALNMATVMGKDTSIRAVEVLVQLTSGQSFGNPPTNPLPSLILSY